MGKGADLLLKLKGEPSEPEPNELHRRIAQSWAEYQANLGRRVRSRRGAPANRVFHYQP